jgi:hypothetical protein
VTIRSQIPFGRNMAAKRLPHNGIPGITDGMTRVLAE